MRWSRWPVHAGSGKVCIMVSDIKGQCWPSASIKKHTRKSDGVSFMSIEHCQFIAFLTVAIRYPHNLRGNFVTHFVSFVAMKRPIFLREVIFDHIICIREYWQDSGRSGTPRQTLAAWFGLNFPLKPSNCLQWSQTDPDRTWAYPGTGTSQGIERKY